MLCDWLVIEYASFLLVGWNSVMWPGPREPGSAPDFLFSTHKERTAGGPWVNICWIWQGVYWIRINGCTFNKACDLEQMISNFRIFTMKVWAIPLFPLLHLRITENHTSPVVSSCLESAACSLFIWQKVRFCQPILCTLTATLDEYGLLYLRFPVIKGNLWTEPSLAIGIRKPVRAYHGVVFGLTLCCCSVPCIISVHN